ncbi:MAG: universal stress protein [Alphaproteobacteria bacterium]
MVDDDQPQTPIEIERREAERILAERIGTIAEFRGVRCRPIFATGDPFDAILRTEADLNSDLIAMGAHRNNSCARSLSGRPSSA